MVQHHNKLLLQRHSRTRALVLMVLLCLSTQPAVAIGGDMYAGITPDQMTLQGDINTIHTNLYNNIAYLKTPALVVAAAGLAALSTLTTPTLASVGGTISSTASLATGSIAPVWLSGGTAGTNSSWLLSDTETLKGLVHIPITGITVASGATVTLDLARPITGPLYFKGNATVNVNTSLTLSSTPDAALFNMSGGTSVVTLTSGGNVVHSVSPVTIPAAMTLKASNTLIIDGHLNRLTFAATSSILDLNGQSVTLRNMIINGLTGAAQIIDSAGSGSLTLENCIINVPAGTTWSLTNGTGTGNFTVKPQGDVVVRGGGTMELAGGGSTYVTIQIQSNSTLTIEIDTTFKYDPSNSARSRVTFADTSTKTSVLYLQGATLRASPSDAGAGILLSSGKLVLDGAVTLNNAGGSSSNNIGFAASQTVVIIPGAVLNQTTGSFIVYNAV